MEEGFISPVFSVQTVSEWVTRLLRAGWKQRMRKRETQESK